ncbi:proteic killer suppression protein [Chitinophaga rupis]|uniref:Proteic killer suppression protein n=1 Tax=Chitinophaga rupis TaxID=573321 RepID=A0A1H8FL28_9BACT|nr:type II toxin-antitoxin system RelE/ParE family toxin [Chitinophaga rupis]SEN32511.1 proteic killer suppression protein [Chitinophaga rupis]
MIQSFQNKALKLLWCKDDDSKLPKEWITKIRHMLQVIDQARAVPHDFGAFINWKIHPLNGEYEGFWSLTVNGNWRVMFRFENGDAYDLDYRDYH